MIYTPSASPGFNESLESTLRRLASDIEARLGDNLVALILGGGYGRGEGAVVHVDGLERPYNDLDLTLVVKHKSAGRIPSLEDIRERYERELDIEVDFSRPLTVADIQTWPHWLMWHDLLNGHQVLHGPKDVLTSNAPERVRENPPPIEATRLLLNRGAGLLWAHRVTRGIEDAPDPDFVRRNYYKCLLACGDAILITHGAFTTQYEGRDRILTDLETEREDIRALDLLPTYRKALQFKFDPDAIEADALDEQDLSRAARVWCDVLLHVESRRTRSPFSTATEYVQWNGVREVELHNLAQRPGHVIRNLRLGRFSLHHPRESLYRSLPVLLGQTPESRADWEGDSERFLATWRRVN